MSRLGDADNVIDDDLHGQDDYRSPAPPTDSPPTCPACGRKVYRISHRYTLGSLRSPGPSYGSVDPTWRHLDDGTVAVTADGALVCGAVQLYLLNLRGGGGDIACADCLGEARRERHHSLVSYGLIDSPNEQCAYCGRAQSKAVAS